MGDPKPHMAWRKSRRIPCDSADPAVILDAIVAWMGDPDSFYDDGTNRVPHQDSAWDVAGVEDILGTTVCVRLQPPTTSTRKNQRVCLMGMATVAGSPALSGLDVFGNNVVYMCHVKDAEHDNETGYAGYDGNPLYATAYWTRWAGVKLNAKCAGIYVYEGTEGFAVEFETQSPTAPISFGIAGDLCDTFEEGRAEADGGIYCLLTGGYGGLLSATFWNSAAANGVLFSQATTAGRPKSLTYTIAGDVVALNANPIVAKPSALSPALLLNSMLGDSYARWPLHVQNASSEWIGRLREVFMVGRRGRTTLQSPTGFPLAFFIAAWARSVASDTLCLEALLLT